MPTPDGAIGSRDLCTGAVVERVIADGGVSSLKISATIQSDNFSSGSAGWQINRETGSAEFQDVVVRGTLNADDITTGTLDANIVTVANLSASAITTGTLDAAQVSVTNLDADNINTGTLDAAHLTVGSITGTYIATGAIDTVQLAAQAVTAAEISTGTITANEMAANSISASAIQANAVTATHINVSTLDAITANMGTLTVNDTLTMGTLGVIRTDSSGANRLHLTRNGLLGYNADNSASGSLYMWSSAVNLQYNGSNYIDLQSGTMIFQVGDAAVVINDAGGDYMQFLLNASTWMEGHTTYIRMESPLRLPDGSVGAPAHTFVNNTDGGLYRIANDYFGMSAGGNLIMQWGYGGNKEIYFYGLANVSANPVHFNTGSGIITYIASTRRMKKDERPMPIGLSDMLSPKQFRYRRNNEIAASDRDEFRVAPEAENVEAFGLIAEDVALIDRRLATFNDGDPVPVNFNSDAVLAAVITDLKDARQRIAVLEAV